MKLRELYRSGAKKLGKAGISQPEHDARQLLEMASGRTFADLLTQFETELSGMEDLAYRFEQYITRRGSREPLQHIIGSVYFMGLRIDVDESVLIPRPDTEILVEAVLNDLEQTHPAGDNIEKTMAGCNTPLSVLDLCTGSGCIAIAVKHYKKNFTVTASDISEKALRKASLNAAGNNTEIRFVKSDMFDNINESFDVIVSNPPYIPTGDIELLEPEVKHHDPLIALDGGADGFVFYRKLIREAPKHLAANGRLYLEIGHDQAAEVGRLLETCGFGGITVIKDLSGQDRVITSILQGNF